MSFAIPVQRLYETKSLVAFHHPRPAYPIHILIVPKKAVASLADLDAGDEFSAVFSARFDRVHTKPGERASNG